MKLEGTIKLRNKSVAGSIIFIVSGPGSFQEIAMSLNEDGKFAFYVDTPGAYTVRIIFNEENMKDFVIYTDKMNIIKKI